MERAEQVPHIFEALERDHEAVLRLLDELGETPAEERGKRNALFEELRRELAELRRAEESVFYAALSGHESTRRLVEEASEDHRILEGLLSELDVMDKDDRGWEVQLDELRETVERHVELEEGELFDAARGVLGMKEGRELGSRWERERSYRKTPNAS